MPKNFINLIYKILLALTFSVIHLLESNRAELRSFYLIWCISFTFLIWLWITQKKITELILKILGLLFFH